MKIVNSRKPRLEVRIQGVDAGEYRTEGRFLEVVRAPRALFDA
jgi:hypothetical protein